MRCSFEAVRGNCQAAKISQPAAIAVRPMLSVNCLILHDDHETAGQSMKRPGGAMNPATQSNRLR
ncbi:hypothetical protein AYO28_21585 [Pseudomonas putida]|uniref:Uncharacterized protein n=1 Tax=Pseudomonas putida TaxID=303 RepID=A0A177SNZ3_PSEPU|nr:hypothetical protein AYO28_21585 [Pseudomonas putida]